MRGSGGLLSFAVIVFILYIFDPYPFVFFWSVSGGPAKKPPKSRASPSSAMFNHIPDATGRSVYHQIRNKLIQYYAQEPLKFSYTPFEDLTCQAGWCLFGDPEKGYCNKCVPNPSWRSSCDRLSMIQKSLVRDAGYPDSVELLRIPAFQFVSYRMRKNLSVLQSDLPHLSPNALKACKQFPVTTAPTASSPPATQYKFNVIAGALLSSTVPDVAWSENDASFKPKHARYGIAWGDAWKYRVKLTQFDDPTSEKLPTTVADELSYETIRSMTRFPNDGFKELTKVGDTGMLFLRTSYLKLSSQVHEVPRRPYINTFDVVSPPLRDSSVPFNSTASRPFIELMKIIRENEDGVISEDSSAVPDVAKMFSRTSCVLISCQKEITTPVEPSKWFNSLRDAQKAFYNALRQKYQSDARGKHYALAAQAAWIRRIATDSQTLIQKTAELTRDQVKEQDRTGYITGLSKTCRMAGVALLDDLKKKADKMSPPSADPARFLDGEPEKLEDLFEGFQFIDDPTPLLNYE